MAKALIIAFRNRRNIDARLFSAALNAGMTPDNLVPAPPLFHQDRGLVNFVFNPTPLVRIQGANICLGRTTASDNYAFSMGAERPDGTFASSRVGPGRAGGLSGIWVLGCVAIPDASATPGLGYGRRSHTARTGMVTRYLGSQYGKMPQEGA
jgi:hypothetical protein